MANYPGFKVGLFDKLKFTDLEVNTISGVVTKDSVPVARMIVVYRYSQFDAPHITFSDPSDGSWSLELHMGPRDRYIVMAISEDASENSQIFDWVME